LINKVSTKKTNAIFITIVLLVAGLIGIGISSPLTTYGESYQNAKCYNTNVNINGLDQEQIQRQDVTNDLGTENAGLTGQQDLTPEEAMNTLSNGNGNNGEELLLDIDRNIVNVCINDNENELTGILTGRQSINPPTCEECFDANAALQTAIENTLVNVESTVTFSNNGISLEIGPNIDTTEQLCALIERSTIPLTDDFIDFLISGLVGVDYTLPDDRIDALIECLLEAGVIIEATV
jgi:hypothetical protein